MIGRIVLHLDDTTILSWFKWLRGEKQGPGNIMAANTVSLMTGLMASDPLLSL